MSENPVAPRPAPVPHVSPVFAGAPVTGARQAPRSPRLGVTALVLALVAAVGATLLSGASAFAATSGAMAGAIDLSPEGLENLSNDQLLALLTPVRGLVLAAEIGFWIGTAAGISALVQGIVAISSRRGRVPAIAAVVIAGIGPVLFAIAVFSAALTGIAAGANAGG